MISIYTILINENSELVNTTPKERIIQRSKLVDKIHFLTAPIYKECDMSSFTVTLEYVLPVSKTYRSENLILSKELYKGQLEYILPIDTALTKEAGDIELQVTFAKVSVAEDGKPIQQVRKVLPTTITITPIAAWSDFIPDEALSAIDQRILKQDAQIKQLEEISKTLDMTKADNITYKENKLQLTSNGEKIGDVVTISSSGSSGGEGGYHIVEF